MSMNQKYRKDYINEARDKYLYFLNKQLEILKENDFVPHNNYWINYKDNIKINPYELAVKEYRESMTLDEKIGEYFSIKSPKDVIDMMLIMDIFNPTPDEYDCICDILKYVAQMKE